MHLNTASIKRWNKIAQPLSFISSHGYITEAHKDSAQKEEFTSYLLKPRESLALLFSSLLSLYLSLILLISDLAVSAISLDFGFYKNSSRLNTQQKNKAANKTSGSYDSSKHH